MIPIADLGPLQFYWRMTDTAKAARPAGIPDFMPFGFSWRSELGLLVQTPRPETAAILERVYTLDENVGYLQFGHDLAESYGQDFLAFVRRELGPRKGASLLELGCGGCWTLAKLASDGHSVRGIDPSPVSARVGGALGLDIVQGFFPDADHGPAPDVIYHADVLEHVADPVAFLKLCRKRLAPGGMIIVAVPDCGPAIAAGDASMIIHQHLNYFDHASLAATFAAAGLQIVALEKSGVGGSLYASAVPSASPSVTIAGQDGASVGARLLAVRSAVLARLSAARAAAGGRAIGFYVPLRALPYLSMAGWQDGFRLFDDDRSMQGRYFDGFPVPVEGFDALVADPPAALFVMSHSFAQVIKKKIEHALGTSIPVMGLADLVARP